VPQQTLSDAQLRQRGLAGLAELARLDDGSAAAPATSVAAGTDAGS